MTRIDVLYEDDTTLVLNKPAGLSVQGGNGVNVSLDCILAAEWEARPLLVHRLDKDTSGVILLAKTRSAAAYYSALIAGREARKLYLAVCAAQDHAEIKNEGLIDLTIPVKGIAKPALTKYRVIDIQGDFAVFELELGTGRMHQIQRHLASSGYPILGDDKYGDFRLNKKMRAEKALKRLLLHSRSLTFKNSHGKELVVQAPLPEYFDSFASKAVLSIYSKCND